LNKLITRVLTNSIPVPTDEDDIGDNSPDHIVAQALIAATQQFAYSAWKEWVSEKDLARVASWALGNGIASEFIVGVLEDRDDEIDQMRLILFAMQQDRSKNGLVAAVYGAASHARKCLANNASRTGPEDGTVRVGKPALRIAAMMHKFWHAPAKPNFSFKNEIQEMVRKDEYEFELTDENFPDLSLPL